MDHRRVDVSEVFSLLRMNSGIEHYGNFKFKLSYLSAVFFSCFLSKQICGQPGVAGGGTTSAMNTENRACSVVDWMDPLLPCTLSSAESLRTKRALYGLWF